MMSSAIKILKSAKKNERFNLDILAADGDKPPGFFASQVEEMIYSTAYYGWLVGKYGSSWEEYL